MHVALYALMIGMPLAGWLILSAEGKPIPFFGLQLPALISENRPLAKLIEEVHETVGTLGYFPHRITRGGGLVSPLRHS